jgi:hypothetical protein
MDILSLLMNHKHYWGVPHRREPDKRLIQTCYGCGAERLILIDLNLPPVPNIARSAQEEKREAA